MSKEFNLKEVLESYPLPAYVKNGFLFYITNNKILIKNNKEFKDELQKYLNLNIGG